MKRPQLKKETVAMRRRMLSLTASLLLLAPTAIVPATAGAARELAAPPAAVASAPAGDFAAMAVEAPAAQVPEGYEPVAETASLRLHVNRADSKLAILDKRTGKLWTSNPLEALSDQKTILDDAVFQLNYTNARRQMTNLASSASEKPDLTFSNIQDGVRIVYDIPKLKLNITVDYAIKEEPRQDVPGQSVAYLQVTLPEGAVKEGGDCSNPTSTTCFMVVTLEMLPLFGAAKVDSDGYLMIPDESGAIVTFKPEYPQYRQRYSAAVYGADAAGQAFSGTSAAWAAPSATTGPGCPSGASRTVTPPTPGSSPRGSTRPTSTATWPATSPTPTGPRPSLSTAARPPSPAGGRSSSTASRTTRSPASASCATSCSPRRTLPTPGWPRPTATT